MFKDKSNIGTETKKICDLHNRINVNKSQIC